MPYFHSPYRAILAARLAAQLRRILNVYRNDHDRDKAEKQTRTILIQHSQLLAKHAFNTEIKRVLPHAKPVDITIGLQPVVDDAFQGFMKILDDTS